MSSMRFMSSNPIRFVGDIASLCTYTKQSIFHFILPTKLPLSQRHQWKIQTRMILLGSRTLMATVQVGQPKTCLERKQEHPKVLVQAEKNTNQGGSTTKEHLMPFFPDNLRRIRLMMDTIYPSIAQITNLLFLALHNILFPSSSPLLGARNKNII